MRHPDERDPGPTRADAEHPDEGTIHAWLDGALPAAEAAALERHVAACAPCAAAVAEARGLVAAASRILGALDDVPGGVVPAAAPATAPALGAPDVAADPAVTSIAAGGARRRARRSWSGWPVRAAAAVALLAVGSWAVVGRGGDSAELARLGADATALDASEDAAPRGPAAPEAVASAAAPGASPAPPAPPTAPPSPAIGGAAGATAAQQGSRRLAGGAAGAPTPPPVPADPRRRVAAAEPPTVVRGAPPAAKAAVDSAVQAGDARAFAAGATTAGAAVAERRAEPAAPTMGSLARPIEPLPSARQAAPPPSAAPPPPPPPPAPAPAPVAANALADLDARLARCWRVELDAAPADSAGRQVERALRGWIRLAPAPMEGGWRPAVPVTDGARAEAAERAPTAGTARWRERPSGEVEVEWPAVGGPVRLLLRPAGEALAGTATPASGPPVRVTLRPGSCGAP